MKQLYILSLASLFVPSTSMATEKPRPNILFVISDDQSWPHASAYGTNWINTPHFDNIAKNGILFTNAFVTSPGCSPSRASILTGRYPWQIEEAGTHASSFPIKYKCFTQILEENGYAVGFTGKAWAPGDWRVSGRNQNPVGKEYNAKRITPPYSGISTIDYAANFSAFMQEREADQPFFFWFGAQEPHRDFEKGSGIKERKQAAEVGLPPFLPDREVVKNDLLDYATEIEWYDLQLGKILKMIRDNGELENTLIIITSDNGMPFPRAKANLYEAGIHVPMAISWGAKIPGGQVIETPFSTIDLAPTILNAAHLKFDGALAMSGKSCLPLFTKKKKQPKTSQNEGVLAGRERHSSARYLNRGYPQRSIRTEKYLFILNYHPEYWPAGDPQLLNDNGNPGPMYSGYMDIDEGPTLQFYRETNDNDAMVAPLFQAATAKRPAEELYDIENDRWCMVNLANDNRYSAIKKQLKKRLKSRLKATADPRETGQNPEIWESYPRLKGETRAFPAEKTIQTEPQ